MKVSMISSVSNSAISLQQLPTLALTQQIALTFEAHGENMSQDADHVAAKRQLKLQASITEWGPVVAQAFNNTCRRGPATVFCSFELPFLWGVEVTVTADFGSADGAVGPVVIVGTSTHIKGTHAHMETGRVSLKTVLVWVSLYISYCCVARTWGGAVVGFVFGMDRSWKSG